jgi:hypothetical protein
MKDAPNRFMLRNLSLGSRLVVAAFLVSVGIGYFLALACLGSFLAKEWVIDPYPIKETLTATMGE